MRALGTRDRERGSDVRELRDIRDLRDERDGGDGAPAVGLAIRIRIRKRR